MKVELISEDCSDLKVVNAARVSFDKASQWEERFIAEGNEIQDTKKEYYLSKGDTKLIHYLAQHKHWTPFAHCQEVFKINMNQSSWLYFFINANLSGFEWEKPNVDFWYDVQRSVKIRGSLYAWLTNNMHFPMGIYNDIKGYLFAKYPVSYEAIIGKLNKGNETGATVVMDYDSLDEFPELKWYTLRLTVPIFVKRQLETHRRNMVLTDVEDFSQNEVSRRYVTSKPEFYTPNTWHTQHKTKKQGASEEVLKGVNEYIVSSDYKHHTHSSLLNYKAALERNVAIEEARMFLPVSTYTSFWWSGSVKSWKRVLNLRLDSNVQGATREVAKMIQEVLDID